MAGALRKLDLRVVKKSASCDRREVSAFAPQLVVDALMPVMPGEDPEK
jgi:hypothetical protein